MGLKKSSWLCWVFVGLCMKAAYCDGTEVSVKILKTPKSISNLNSATFNFKVFVGETEETCTNCATHCKLDDRIPSECDAGEISYTGLQDGNHTFEVCANGSLGCASYIWTVDTVAPTAYVTAATPFTGAPYVTVNIVFSKPCAGGGGFRCASVDACNVST